MAKAAQGINFSYDCVRPDDLTDLDRYNDDYPYSETRCSDSLSKFAKE